MAAFGAIPAISEPSVKPASPTRNQDIPQATGDHHPNDEGEFVGGQHSLNDGGLFTAILKGALTRGFVGRRAVCE